ncbi:TrbG/VirB9 family P-type conjugative transfer protein [Thalassospira mesophila]|uniref:TrbG/VirB9 family P-type conjugative transfer protein n=1 Tax=Thalassospira mesophila TaxID=1293891 RepID=UPI001FE7ADD4|nr:TrbG/VirB9 family P-type conjugative transfer protein [Thalassospira mesophila]
MKNSLRKFAWTLALAALLVSLAAVFVINAAQAQTPAFTSSRPPMPGQRQNTNTQANAANTTNSNGQQTDAAASASPAPKVPAMPVPDSVVKQAKDQAEGRFGPMVRPRTSGQIQDVWDYAEKSDGVYVTDICEACTYRVRTREYLVTLIELPKGEQITRIDVGDPRSWSVNKRDDRRIAIRPASYGYDTSMIVYGASQNVYPFYLRAEGVNSINMPDLLVRLKGSVATKDDMTVAMVRPEERLRYGSSMRTALQDQAGIVLPTPETGSRTGIEQMPLGEDGQPQTNPSRRYANRSGLVEGQIDSDGNIDTGLSYDGTLPTHPDDPVTPKTTAQNKAAKGTNDNSDKTATSATKVANAVHDLSDTDPGTPTDDFVADAGFDPNKLRGWGDYDLWGDDELRPITVFRDDYFTYIRFGDRWKDLELPTAYVVVDGVDELVNTRIQGHTFIVESTQRLISLKSGMKFLCIEYEGD